MATIVLHKPTNQKYVLVGAGFGTYKSSMPGLFGAATPVEDAQSFCVLSVCGADGSVGWLRSDEVTVVTVDGKSPHQLLNAASPYR